jgi:hypothetical protein
MPDTSFRVDAHISFKFIVFKAIGRCVALYPLPAF